MSIRVKVSFKYSPKLVTSKERNPKICFWASREIGHSFVKVDPRRERHSFEITLKTERLSAGSTLSFQDFVDTENSRKEPSSNEAGSNFVYWIDVLKDDQDTVIKDIPLVVWNAKRKNVDAVKGVLTELRFERVTFPDNVSPFKPIEKQTLVGANKDHIVSTLVGHLQRQALIFEQKNPTFPQLSRLHLPTWNFNSWQLPGAAFAMVRAKPSPEAWWTNALNIALRRHYPKMSLEGASSYMLHMAAEEELVTIMSKMHSIYINECTYLSDGIPVKKKEKSWPASIKIPFISTSSDKEAWEFISMEAFSCNIRSRGAAYQINVTEKNSPKVYYVPPGADCEDGSAEQGFESMELRNRTDWTDPRLKKLHQIRQNYYYLQVLMGVRGAKASDGKDEGASAYKKLGGHMTGAYISKELFFLYHQRWNTAAEPYEGVATSCGRGERSPIQFIEGTGLIDPGCSQQYVASMRSYLYLNNAMPGVLSVGKFIAPQFRNKMNKFFRVVQSYCVLDLVDEGFSNPEHIPLKRVNGEWRTGVSYLDFVNEAKDIASYAQPEMDEDTVRVTKELLNQAFPIEPFQVPERLSTQKAFHEELDAVKQFTTQLGRPSSDSYDVVQMYLRFDQLNSVRESYIDLVKRAGQVFKFRYYNEEIEKGFGGYQVRFYVAWPEEEESPGVGAANTAHELLGHPHFQVIQRPS